MQTKASTNVAATLDFEPLLKPHELNAEVLKRLIGGVERSGARFIDWERFGKPRIDRFVAHLDVPLAQAGAVVQSVLATDGLRPNLRVFPKGIPVIDGLRIELDLAAAPV